jgi:hypothetical protein
LPPDWLSDVDIGGEPKAYVEITLADVYATLLKVDKATASLVDRSEAAEKRGDDHETRLRALEQEAVRKRDLAASQTRTIAVLSVVAAFLSAGVAVISRLIG